MTTQNLMEGSRRWVSTALPLLVLAALVLLAVTIRSEAGPGLLAAATPTPDAVLKQQCIEGAAVGSGNDGLASDCALLLAGKDTLRGTETLNWSASLAIASWEGITVGGSPSRVTLLHIDGWTATADRPRDPAPGHDPRRAGRPLGAPTAGPLPERIDGDDPGRAGSPP